jgi:hypothetical protein
VQLVWCAGSVVLGLLLALVLDASPGTVALGWTVAALGLLGIVLTYALPMRGKRR